MRSVGRGQRLWFGYDVVLGSNPNWNSGHGGRRARSAYRLRCGPCAVRFVRHSQLHQSGLDVVHHHWCVSCTLRLVRRGHVHQSEDDVVRHLGCASCAVPFVRTGQLHRSGCDVVSCVDWGRDSMGRKFRMDWLGCVPRSERFVRNPSNRRTSVERPTYVRSGSSVCPKDVRLGADGHPLYVRRTSGSYTSVRPIGRPELDTSPDTFRMLRTILRYHAHVQFKT